MPFKGYRITSNYGPRRDPITGKENTFHAGIDLVASPKDAPVESFTEGVVIYAGWGNTGSGFGNYGYVVFIQDEKGNGHVYAHLSSVSVKLGNRVKKGQVIGRQGSTGKSTGPHVHYEVRKAISPSYGWKADRKGSTYNPTAYLIDYNKPKKTSGLPGGVVKQGARGDSVRKIQEALASVYFYPEKGAKNNGVDGIYGPKTADAVKRFQSLNGLKQDGIYGPQTKKKIEEVAK